MSVLALTTSRRISRVSRSQLLPGYWITATSPITGLSYYSDLDCVGCWVVDSKVIGKFANYRPCVFRSVVFYVHPLVFACAHTGYLIVAAFPSDILMYRVAFRIA